MTRRGISLLLFVSLCLLFSGGCIKRNLHIISDPPGAAVYFNEEEIGTSPLDYDFMYYAEHKIELKKEGYKPIRDLVSIRTPFYFWIPLDLIAQLVPYTFWDRRGLSYILTPVE